MSEPSPRNDAPGRKPLRPNPTRPRLWVRTWTPPPGRLTHLMALNDAIHGFNTHFIPGGPGEKGRTVPCLEPHFLCPWHDHVRNRKWKGYLGVLLDGESRPCIWEVSEGAYEGSPELQHFDGQLRGWRWEIGRAKDDKRSRQTVRKILSLHKGLKAPRIDVLNVLSRIWQTPVETLVRVCGTDEGIGGWGFPGKAE